MNFYNENEPIIADWLEQLIKDEHIYPGRVDRRDVSNISGRELKDYTQVHLFAGIGGWAHALRLAGWNPARPVWTGSCPCQPFSDIGQKRGEEDPRHLWPQFRRAVKDARPPVIFGEQVSSKAGEQWLARVRADLEKLGYAVGCANLCAAGVGAPHIRQRLFWVAYLKSHGWREEGSSLLRPTSRTPRTIKVGGVGDGDSAGLEGHTGHEDRDHQPGRVKAKATRSAATASSYWDSFDVLQCTDGRSRRIEPGTFPMVDGFPERVAHLHGYGNAIVPQLAAEFIKASEEALMINT